ncbi:hypothetical protein ACFWZ2_13230 [Streptomyces sp. NPDC059002]|uniref:hypothetical protein n=1 Tax=Streptomyces sp. NPDC059002 TaxID=3346690 RepID=UPI0036C0CBC0
MLTFGLRTDGTTLYAFAEVADPWYYWGGAWYRGGTRWITLDPLQFTVTFDSQVILDAKTTGGVEGSGRGESSGVPYPGDGTFKLTGSTTVIGPYWEVHAAAIVPSQTTQLDLYVTGQDTQALGKALESISDDSIHALAGKLQTVVGPTTSPSVTEKIAALGHDDDPARLRAQVIAVVTAIADEEKS